MRKVKTPIQQLITEIQTLQSKAEKIKDVAYLDGVISILELKLPDEKNIIIDFAIEYKHQCFQTDDPVSARTLFTQTFD